VFGLRIQLFVLVSELIDMGGKRRCARCAGCTKSFFERSGIEASVKMFRQEFAMRRLDHVAVFCRHFKSRYPAAGAE
jgi:hypothetical protein